MKILVMLLSLISISRCFGSINDELATLFNAKNVAALVPAKEGRVDQVDPWYGAKAFGFHFDPGLAFSLEEESFEKAFTASTISSWTFSMVAPWSPGTQTTWLALNHAGVPYLSIRLISDQPKLIVISQVVSLADGVATRGLTHQYFFRCEITSEGFASFLRDTAKARSMKKFVIPPEAEGIEDVSNPIEEKKDNKSEMATPRKPSD